MKSSFKQISVPYLLVTLFCIAFLLGPYILSNLILPRTEELNYSLYPLVLWSRQLLAGAIPLWFNDCALGIPWPIPHTMSHTPLVMLFSVLPVYKALAGLLAVHIAIQAFFTIRITQYFGLMPATRIVVLISVLLASPMEYLISSDAAAVFLSWTLLPVVLYALLRLIEPMSLAYTSGYTILLGGVVGYGILNGHAGVFSTHVLGIVLIALFYPRMLLRRWYVFLLGALLAIGLGAEKIYTLFHELPYFDKDTIRLQYTFGQEPYYIFWNLFIKPFAPSFHVLNREYWDIFINKNSMSRALTFDSPLCSILLLCGFVCFLRGRSLVKNTPLVRAMWLTLLTCFLIQFTPTRVLPVFISASWTFRDPAILIGILLAGVLCDQWLRQVLHLTTVNFLLGTHVVLLLLCAAIFTYGPNLRSYNNGAVTNLYNQLSNSEESFPLPRMIREKLVCREDLDSPSCKELTKRVVYDGLAAFIAHYGDEKDKGLHLNVLPLYGLQEVSFLTKGLSLDAIHPSQSKPYGMISTLRFVRYTYDPGAFDWVQESPALLNLLGIRMVVGMDNPGYEAHGLKRLSVINPKESKAKNILVLYKNLRPFPRAFFVSNELLGKVKPIAQCPKGATFLTCLDVSPITNHTDPWQDLIHVQDKTNGLILSFSPSSKLRTLLVTTMFRPEWQIHGGKLSSFNGLMRIELPVNTTRVILDYKPRQLILARSISLASMLLTILGLFIVLVLAYRKNVTV